MRKGGEGKSGGCLERERDMYNSYVQGTLMWVCSLRAVRCLKGLECSSPFSLDMTGLRLVQSAWSKQSLAYRAEERGVK